MAIKSRIVVWTAGLLVASFMASCELGIGTPTPTPNPTFTPTATPTPAPTPTLVSPPPTPASSASSVTVKPTLVGNLGVQAFAASDYSAFDVFVSGTLAFVAQSSFSRSGGALSIVDISDPAAPVEVGSVPEHGSVRPLDVFVVGDLATCDPAETLPLAQRYMLR